MLRPNTHIDPVIAPKEIKAIKQLEHLLSLENSQAKLIAANGEEIYIPEPVYQLLRQVVQAIASEKAIHIVPQEQEMTTQEAAELLNVSRPYLIKLLEQGDIPYIKVGTHRRILFEDLMQYKENRNNKRQEGLKELTQFLQTEGFYEAGVADCAY